MKPRERRLGIIVGCVLGLGAAYKGVRYLYLDPLGQAQADFGDRLAEKEKLEALIGAEHGLAFRWNEYAKRTLASTPAPAQERLGERLKTIATHHGFHDAIFDKKIGAFKIGKDTQIVAMGFKIITKGEYQRTVEFLREIYRAPFLCKVTNLSLTPLDTRGVVGRDLVKAEFTVDTPILPKIKAGDIDLASRAEPLAPELLDTLPQFRNNLLPDAAYAVLGERNVFKAFLPAPTSVVTIDNKDRKDVVVILTFSWEGKETEQLPKSVAGTRREPIPGKGDEVEVRGSYADGTEFGPERISLASGKEAVYVVPSHTAPEPDTVVLAVDNQHDRAISLTLTIMSKDGKETTLPPMTIEAKNRVPLSEWKAEEVRVMAKYPSERIAKEETFRPSMDEQTFTVLQELEMIAMVNPEDPAPDARYTVTGLWIRPDLHELIASDGAERKAFTTLDQGAIDGGTLHAAVPGLGGIVRMAGTGNYYMYPLGGNFKDRVLLDAEDEHGLPAAIDAWTRQPGLMLTTSEPPAPEGEQEDGVGAAAPSAS